MRLSHKLCINSDSFWSRKSRGVCDSQFIAMFCIFRNLYYMRKTNLREIFVAPVIENQTNSAFLIPRRLLPNLQILAKKRKISQLLGLFLVKYRSILVSDRFRASFKVKTRFQERGLDLVRVSFLPKNDDWILLGLLAVFLGISRCLLFRVMLELEIAGESSLIERSSEKNVTLDFIRGFLSLEILLDPQELEGYQRKLWTNQH